MNSETAISYIIAANYTNQYRDENTSYLCISSLTEISYRLCLSHFYRNTFSPYSWTVVYTEETISTLPHLGQHSHTITSPPHPAYISWYAYHTEPYTDNWGLLFWQLALASSLLPVRGRTPLVSQFPAANGADVFCFLSSLLLLPPVPPDHHGSVWLLHVISLLLTN